MEAVGRVRWGGWAYLLDVDRMACAAKDEGCSHCLCKSTCLAMNVRYVPWRRGKGGTYLVRDLLLVFSGEVDEMVILGTH